MPLTLTSRRFHIKVLIKSNENVSSIDIKGKVSSLGYSDICAVSLNIILNNELKTYTIIFV